MKNYLSFLRKQESRFPLSDCGNDNESPCEIHLRKEEILCAGYALFLP